MFKRALGPWCMTPSFNTYCQNYTATAVSCTKTPNERVAGWNWLNSSYPLYAIWISGVRKPECVGNASCQGMSAFSFADPTLSASPTGYLFNTGKPDGTGADCLAFRVNSDRTCGIDNIQCDQIRTSDNSTCLSGQICGFPPS
ncbi:hypothetical protein GCK72_007118 [Caenorhabditis remanei]|uniref:Uncharacterized protein n=1 Tax=Caenorhabditis remanei TaxID=31234 RepID=A0A6A5HIB9_CAERE|nr:hypothetical protein GCK72_007118 [Caenorhabditis remanei]KAF1767159.1 hypothetical protein GCK72_007118 [Caenorhabditis remanei]